MAEKRGQGRGVEGSRFRLRDRSLQARYLNKINLQTPKNYSYAKSFKDES
jgi:hypothetical protein